MFVNVSKYQSLNISKSTTFRGKPNQNKNRKIALVTLNQKFDVANGFM